MVTDMTTTLTKKCSFLSCNEEAEYSISPEEPWNVWFCCETHLPPIKGISYREYRDRVRVLT